MRRLLPAALTTALPSLCAVCHDWGRTRVCAACQDRHASAAHRCTRCAMRVTGGALVCGACLTRPPPDAPAFDRALAAVDYQFPWADLIQQLKFHNGLDLAPSLSDLLTRAVHAAPRTAEQPMPSLIVPVPLSPERLRERGYNQAWELARRVARRLQITAQAQWVLRVKDTAHQLSLPPPERASNVRGAFAIEPMQRTAIAGQRIAIVDDVMTTGATLNELARTLKQAGATHVQVWVLARTPQG